MVDPQLVAGARAARQPGQHLRVHDIDRLGLESVLLSECSQPHEEPRVVRDQHDDGRQRQRHESVDPVDELGASRLDRLGALLDPHRPVVLFDKELKPLPRHGEGFRLALELRPLGIPDFLEQPRDPSRLSLSLKGGSRARSPRSRRARTA